MASRRIAPVRLDAQSIVKRFGGTAALAGVPLTLEPGRVHALVGENGAGKSTLLKIAGGLFPPDSGRMTLGDMPYAPPSTAAARRQGVALVFQELTISPTLSVAENIFIDALRRFAGRTGLISRRRMEDAAAALLARLELDIDPATEAERLDLGQMKCVEICRGLAADPAIVLLDEATAFLNHRESRVVLDAMDRLRKLDLAVCFVSHHLDEVFAVADDVTVLKDGTFVGRYHKGDIGPSKLHELMVGRDLARDLFPPRSAPPATSPILRVERALLERDALPFDLTLGSGEILGFAGLKRAGGDQVMEALAGDTPLYSGAILLDGRKRTLASPADAWKAGISYLPGDRTGQGLITQFSVSDNIAMAARPSRSGFYLQSAADALARDAMTVLAIKAEGLTTPVEALSGGNMQKVLLGKCLAVRPRVLLLSNPTRGVDLGARQEIYVALRNAAASGCAIILLSEDLPELIGLSDRIAVFKGNTLTAVFDAAQSVAESDIIAKMT
jgi:ribose transport system ATP-binding protein